jgi:UDP-N-acetylmuramate dehydrogenase
MVLMTPGLLTTAELRAALAPLGGRVQWEVPLARHTAARIGGPAQALAAANSADELAEIAALAWLSGVPLTILGAGSNVLVSDRGVRGLVVLNEARRAEWRLEGQPPQVWAESGTNFGLLARQAAARGLAGLEWAAGIPGTLGGALVGNAGAHGGDLAGNLFLADILQRDETMQTGVPFIRSYSPAELGFAYRSSLLKRHPGSGIVLSMTLHLAQSSVEAVQQRSDELVAYRRRTQPPGASMGSMFKNPPGDYAGRLIEAAGLKGARSGDAGISTLHANFFINHGAARADDVHALIRQARQAVYAQSGILLELEVELLGDWPQEQDGAR